MKVLFAVSNEEISESIVKRYQKEYKEIISYKNVYYYNAILKEIQKDKTYDRIVISEDLEVFTHTQYDQIDKFIFDKLDNISDEASNVRGEDIPIILICSDRRSKSEQMLVKLFGIGVYNAILGNDRSVEDVCRLINKPRLKKDAKTYYKIDSDDVNYQPENENEVSEIEIQNILAHYKRLGKNEDKYVESFDNIAAQYNDAQLRAIGKFLPLNVKAVLEERSPKYQKVVSFNTPVSDNLRKQKIREGEEENKGTSGTLLMPKTRENIMTGPVVIPNAVNMQSERKLSRKKEVVAPEPKIVASVPKTKEPLATEVKTSKPEQTVLPKQPTIEAQVVEEVEAVPEVKEEVPVKRKRGRPRKNPLPDETAEPPVKRKRGRPRKNPLPEEVKPEIVEETILPGFESEEVNILPGIEDTEEITMLPGFEEDNQEDTLLPGVNEESNEEIMLPGFEEEDIISPLSQRDNSTVLPKREEEQEETIVSPIQLRETVNPTNYRAMDSDETKQQGMERREYHDIPSVDISHLLTGNKKVACFVGTSKNGTSFIVNHMAEILSSKGIDTAILDTTQNRNSYYIYTDNDEQLRNTAANSLQNLIQGVAQGVKVNKTLTVYTSLPDDNDTIYHTGEILQTLLQNHDMVLIDCDFLTPYDYFAQAQEIYLVQSYDVLTIQPLTAFLRELKAKNILDESKLRVVLNKSVKIKGINEKTIIGGMSSYNDPAMSFMVELFDRNLIRYLSVPFDEEVYIYYLQGLVHCDISVKKYPKNFLQIMYELANMVYPLVSGKSTYQPPAMSNNGFTPTMNSTLDQMRKY